MKAKKKKLFTFKGVAALVVVFGFFALSFSRTFHTSFVQDETLLAALKYELSTENSQADLIKEYSSLDPEHPFRSSVIIEKVFLSRKLFSQSTSEKVIVCVIYRLLDGGPHRTKYFQFRHSLAADWMLEGTSTALLFYLNFI